MLRPRAPPIGGHAPIQIFNSTADSALIERDLNQSFILDDVAAWGPGRIEQLLGQILDEEWKVAVFDEWKYLIKAPTKEWQLSATRRGTIRMGGVQFPIIPWEPRFSEGKKLTSLWVRIRGYPHLLWNWFEVDRMFNPLGAVLLEMDAATGSKYDYRFVRARIGICDISLLPPMHWMLHRDATGYVSHFPLEFEVEDENTEPVNAWMGRAKEKLQMMKNHPRQVAGKGDPTGKQGQGKRRDTLPPPDKGKKVADSNSQDQGDPEDKEMENLEDPCHGFDETVHDPDTSDDESFQDKLQKVFATNLNSGAGPSSKPKSHPIPKGSGCQNSHQHLLDLANTMQQMTEDLFDELPLNLRVQISGTHSLTSTPAPSPQPHPQDTPKTKPDSPVRGSGRATADSGSPPRSSPKGPPPNQRHSPVGDSPAKPIDISDERELQMVVYTPQVAAEAVRAEPRKSLRLRVQGAPVSVLTKAKKRARTKEVGDSSSGSAGIPLITNFPYNRLTIQQIVDLFRVYQIQLGATSQDQHTIIQALRDLGRPQFEKVIETIMSQTKSINNNDLIVLRNIETKGEQSPTVDTYVPI